jgi:hypothetical protein
MDDNAGWEAIETLNTVSEAELIVGFLRSQGIPAQIESRYFTQEPVNLGTLGKVRVYVPEERAQEARQLLAEQAAQVDEDEVDETT